MKKTFLLLATCLCATSLMGQYPVKVADVNSKVLTNYTVSWLGNDGGCQRTHIPHTMSNMFVHPNGTVATICGWDEGGTNVAVFRNGELISVPEGSGTGGWGRFSGCSVALDEEYVYQLLTQHGCDGGNGDLNINGKPQFPPCSDSFEWKTIRRYNVETGKGAPFADGFGYKGDMLVVCTEKARELKGLAITNNELIVAVKGTQNIPDSIKVYNKEKMTFKYGYPVKGGVDLIYADGKDGVWMLRGQSIILINQKNGELKGPKLELPENVNIQSFSLTPDKKNLLVANRGEDMDVLIYDNLNAQPRLKQTFGTKGGVFAKEKGHLQGEVGELRFPGPTCAGVDSKGVIYVSNTFVGNGIGSVLEAYNLKSQKRLWKREGLIFTATADFDRNNKEYYYTPEKLHKVIIPDNGRGQRLDELVAYTVNPFLFEDDERSKKDGGFITSTFKRTINGEDFLFVSDMYGGSLAGYRFDKEKYGYIGVPFFFAVNGDPEKDRPITFWVDENGDGARQDGEYAPIKEINQYSMSFFVDQAGNIWRGTRGQGFLFWEVNDKNVNGLPSYKEAKLFALPNGFSDAKRIYYDPERDELFLAGFSPKFQDKRDTWWAMGSTIAKCSNVLRRINSGDTNTSQWNPDLLLYLPFGEEDGRKLDYTNAKAFAVEGDYIFIALAREGYITIYDRESGEYVGRLQPNDDVCKESGWSDFNYNINVQKQADGSYFILIEENAFAKVLRYHWIP